MAPLRYPPASLCRLKSALGSLSLRIIRRVVIGFPLLSCSSMGWRSVPSTLASTDMLALGLRLCVRPVGAGFHHLRVSTTRRWSRLPWRRSTHRHWVPFTFASFDTSALGSLCLRVIGHVGAGIPVPLCRSTRRRWAPFAFVSFDTLALGSLCLCVVRHLGVGYPLAFALFDTSALSFDVSGALLSVIPFWRWVPSPRCRWSCRH